MKLNKKGQFNAFAQLAVGIVTLALILTITFMVLDQGRTQSTGLADSQTFTNSTETFTADAFFSPEGNCIEEASLSVSEVYNGTQGLRGVSLIQLEAGNYTIDNNLLNLSDDRLSSIGGLPILLGGTVNMTFSCPIKSKAYNSTVTLTNATNTIPGWVPLIVIATIGTALLGLVALFRRR